MFMAPPDDTKVHRMRLQPNWSNASSNEDWERQLSVEFLNNWFIQSGKALYLADYSRDVLNVGYVGCDLWAGSLEKTVRPK